MFRYKKDYFIVIVYCSLSLWICFFMYFDAHLCASRDLFFILCVCIINTYTLSLYNLLVLGFICQIFVDSIHSCREYSYFLWKKIFKDRILTIDQKLNNPNHNSTFRTLFVVRFISDTEIVTSNTRGRNETRNARVSE